MKTSSNFPFFVDTVHHDHDIYYFIHVVEIARLITAALFFYSFLNRDDEINLAPFPAYIAEENKGMVHLITTQVRFQYTTMKFGEPPGPTEGCSGTRNP